MGQEGVEIKPSDVGSADELLGQDAEAPEEVVEEKIETGKLEGAIKERFLSIYRLVAPLGDSIDHSPQSVRHHVKVGKRGIAVMFYNKNPSINLPVAVEGQKKAIRVGYKITAQGLIAPDGESITQKDLVKQIKEYKKARNL